MVDDFDDLEEGFNLAAVLRGLGVEKHEAKRLADFVESLNLNEITVALAFVSGLSAGRAFEQARALYRRRRDCKVWN